MDEIFSNCYHSVRATRDSLAGNQTNAYLYKFITTFDINFRTELIFGIVIGTASKMKDLSLCIISLLYIGIVVITAQFLILTVLVTSDIQYLLSNDQLMYSSCLSNVNLLGFSTWQMIQYIVALYAIIKFQIDFNTKRKKKLNRYSCN